MSGEFPTFDENTTPEDYLAAIAEYAQGVSNCTTIVGMPPGQVLTVAESDEMVVFENGTMFADWVGDLTETLSFVNSFQNLFNEASWNSVEHLRPEIGSKNEVVFA